MKTSFLRFLPFASVACLAGCGSSDFPVEGMDWRAITDRRPLPALTLRPGEQVLLARTEGAAPPSWMLPAVRDENVARIVVGLGRAEIAYRLVAVRSGRMTVVWFDRRDFSPGHENAFPTTEREALAFGGKPLNMFEVEVR